VLGSRCRAEAAAAYSETTILQPVGDASLAKANAMYSGLKVIVWSAWCCVGCCAVGVVAGSVIVIVECAASLGGGGGGGGAVASLALAMTISPHHLRNIFWVLSP
jgi:hypothetical protein